MYGEPSGSPSGFKDEQVNLLSALSTYKAINKSGRKRLTSVMLQIVGFSPLFYLQPGFSMWFEMSLLPIQRPHEIFEVLP